MNPEIVTAFIAVLALLIALGLALQIAGLRRRLAAVPKDGNVIDLMRSIDSDLANAEAAINDHAPRLQALESRMPRAISFTGVVTYDAFGDVGGKLSRSIALLNSIGDGLVISLLVGRSETHFFTKEVRAGSGTERLSPEEDAAISRAMGR
ncbi:MAG: DUF4446 family protein [Acidimicrobiia bacterium]|nr:DUF4446 family protein [Acidimicrobiia bacterium]